MDLGLAAICLKVKIWDSRWGGGRMREEEKKEKFGMVRRPQMT